MSAKLVEIALTFGLLSVLSIGGANATIPEIHRQVVLVHHWMSDAVFANLVAIGQTAPGPNVLIVSAIGWHLAGVAGLLVASAAMVVPSSVIAWTTGRLIARRRSETVSLVRRALTPVAAGFMFASGLVMTQAAYRGVLSLAIVATVAGSIYLTRLSPLWGIAGGAVLGIAGRRLHLFG